MHSPKVSRMIRSVLASRSFIPAALAAGIILRLAWIAWITGAGMVPASDAAWYHARALEMASGAGYAIDGNPTAYWPVGYPAFLAGITVLFGPSPLAGMLANVVLYAGVLLLAYLLARRLFDSEPAGRLTLLLLALYPNHIAYSSLLLSETLSLLLMLGGIALTLRMASQSGLWVPAGAGLLFGLAALVKPQMLAVPAVTLLALSFPKWKKWRTARPGAFWGNAAAIHLAMLLVLFPWMIRNYDLFGRFGILSNNGGINLLIGNNPEATGAYHLNDRIEGYYNDLPDEAARNERANGAALDYIAEQPAEALARLPRKLWYLYRADTEGFSLNATGLPSGSSGAIRGISMLKILSQIWYLALLGGCIGYPVLILRRRIPRWPALGLLMILYWSVIPLIFFGNGRFHFPAMPWAVMYGAAFLGTLLVPPETRGPGGESEPHGAIA